MISHDLQDLDGRFYLAMELMPNWRKGSAMVSFVSLTHARITWKGILIEKLSTLGWPLAMSMEGCII